MSRQPDTEHPDVLLRPSDIVYRDSPLVLLDSKRMHIAVARLGGEGEMVVKRFKMCDEEAVRRFNAERRHLNRLSRECANVLRPCGTIVEAPMYALVLPYCRLYGSLDQVIHGVGRPSPTDAWRLCLVHDCVAGVVAAHASAVVLRDIKPANVLVGDDGVGRLSDLELALTLEELRGPPPRHSGGPASKPRKRFEGTPEYVAPEQVNAYVLVPGAHAQMKSASFASDVYALGITINQVMTGVVPYSDVERTDEQLHTVIGTSYTPLALCRAVADEALRPKLVEGPMGSIIQNMWAQDRGERPDMKAVVSWMDDFLHPLDTAPARRDRIGPFTDGGCLPANGPAAETATQGVVAMPQPASVDGTALMRVVAALDAVQAAPEKATIKDTDCDMGGKEVENPRRRHFLAGAGEGMPGRRELMEDAFAVVEWVPNEAACYVLADGHAGDACAKFVCAQLPASIASAVVAHSNCGISKDVVASCIKSAFADVESMWQAQAKSHGDTSGACAIAALVLGDHLWVAHCGDCRAVLDRGGESECPSYESLTTDHVITPKMVADMEVNSEAKRVSSLGGSFITSAEGRHRVQATGGKGGLQVTRSFGDAPRYLGVTAEPDVAYTRIQLDDATLILATDGLWDVMSAQSAVQRVRKTCRHKDFGAKRLVVDAYDSGSTDNICAIVVYLSELGYSIDTTYARDASK